MQPEKIFEIFKPLYNIIKTELRQYIYIICTLYVLELLQIFYEYNL